MVPDTVLASIATATRATDVRVGETLQELWSGYGGIIRLHLYGATVPTAILKLIKPPRQASHPRGWNTDASHLRKLRSYQVETHWYAQVSSQCDSQCYVPRKIAVGSEEDGQWICMEDLAERYPARASSLTFEQASVCLRWLAAFHARFLGQTPTGLWPQGTYWHLATRQDELSAMPAGQLKNAAALLDARLNQCEHQTFVHGDAKVANFCFSDDKTSSAAVDFQYVGGGVGVKDVAYFLGSCLDENTIERHEAALLSVYFKALNERVTYLHSKALADSVERAWSDLYAIAWTDFYRFLEGWMPGHKKINRYTRHLADRAFKQLY